MRFMMMIKSDAKTEAGGPPDQALLTAIGTFNDWMATAGVMLGCDGLQPTAKGARVRRSGKKLTVIEGPFGEARELVAGFWLIQAPSLQEAIVWAKRVPCGDGEIELRRLWEMSDFPAPAAGEDWRATEAQFRDEHGQGERPAGAATAAPTTPPRKAGTKPFMVLLKSDAYTESGKVPTDAALNKMGALMEELSGSGALLSGEGLRPSREGARVKIADGKRTVLDGPFTETKEMIAGYTMIQVPALADAIEFAKQWLMIHVETGIDLHEGEIEIRQVFELDDLPADTSESGWREREAGRRQRLEGRPA